MMLMGEHQCVMDEKGRLNFPAKMRDAIGETFVVTRWLDKCLVAFPPGEWEHLTQMLEEKSVVKRRDLERFLFSGATEVKPDKQGRIMIPPALRRHASLEKDAVVIGAGRRAEIWNAGAWQEKLDTLDSDYAEAVMEALEF